MVLADEADARAAQLLAAHLTAAQRAEYATTGRISVVKRGIVWSILLRQVLVLIPFAPLLSVPAWRLPSLVLLAVVLMTLAPFWGPRFRLAITRRREWVISARSAPVLRSRDGTATRFCVRFTEELPDGDRVLAWKNLVELSEPRFLRIANVIG